VDENVSADENAPADGSMADMAGKSTNISDMTIWQKGAFLVVISGCVVAYIRMRRDPRAQGYGKASA
jgi:hypothetical protein